jgi:hypothetical protein
MYFRIATVTGLAIAGIAGAGSTAAAQRPAPAVPSVHVASGPSLTAPDVARLRVTLARADALAAENRVSDAARLYWSVVAEQRTAAEYPAEALRRIAVMYFAVDEEYMAAEVFMELAESAAEFGDATTRLRSLFDAALMYQHLGRTDRVAECVRQIWPLLKSPAIPSSIRVDFMARMTGP